MNRCFAHTAKLLFHLLLLITYTSCGQAQKEGFSGKSKKANPGVALIVLGTVQDAGSPQIACKKACCAALFENPDLSGTVVSMGIIDSKAQKTFLFEATPDITEQLKRLKEAASWVAPEMPSGIFLTHAHIGHYTGLMYLGKEAANAQNVPVYAMPKMESFLRTNGPWGQLVSSENIQMKSLENKKEVTLTQNVSVTPFIVPHRDEYSETVGYKIVGPLKKALFIPDIDKWEKWETQIISEIEKVDYAFLDATFYNAEEINNRDISEIPHPLVIESMGLFENLAASEKKKIHFIHFNHTNPLLNPKSEQFNSVLENGFHIAEEGMQIQL